VEPAPRQIKLVLEYDGTALCGWQRQANGPTVQGHLEEALATFLQVHTPVSGASRTDAGVHARGQVASFFTTRSIPLHGIRRGVNALLPRSIAIRETVEVDPTFHPRFSATGKHYRYTLWARAERSPLWRDRAWHYPDPLDLEAMRAGAAVLLGEHDFGAFRSAGCTAPTAVRRIDRIEVGYAEPHRLTVDIHGNAFLRNMVRIVVGTLADVGRGYRTPAQLAEILEARDRTKAGRTAPPHGLELMEVRYDGTRPGRPVRDV
jgi:tRNA pseudouridine38-40 synthase